MKTERGEAWWTRTQHQQSHTKNSKPLFINSKLIIISNFNPTFSPSFTSGLARPLFLDKSRLLFFFDIFAVNYIVRCGCLDELWILGNYIIIIYGKRFEVGVGIGPEWMEPSSRFGSEDLGSNWRRLFAQEIDQIHHSLGPC